MELLRFSVMFEKVREVFALFLILYLVTSENRISVFISVFVYFFILQLQLY
jgi:hypothetical protein